MGQGKDSQSCQPFFSSDFSVAAVRDREDPSDDLMLLPAKDRVPSINSVTGINWNATPIHGTFHSGSLHY